MKKKSINEALGVPKDILLTSEQIYEDILKEFDNIDHNSNQYELNIRSTGLYKIGDYNINEISLTINLYEHDDFELIGASVSSELGKIFVKDRAAVLHKKNNNVELQIDFSVPKDWELNDFKSFLKKSKKEILPVLSHELMHSYDAEKSTFSSIKKRGEYNAAKRLMGFMPPLEELSFFIYFISKIESVVRPSEVSMYLRQNNVKPKEFLNFMLEDRTHKNLIKIRNFTFDGLKDKIKKFVQDPDNKRNLNYFFYHFLEIKDADKLNDDEKVEEILRSYHILFLDHSIKSTMEMVFAPIIPKWFLKMGYDVEKLINREKNFRESTDNFFKRIEKKFKFESNKLLRKLYKLYAMLEDDKINESIVNYKLYSKINNLEEKNLKRLFEIIKERKLNGKGKPKK